MQSHWWAWIKLHGPIQALPFVRNVEQDLTLTCRKITVYVLNYEAKSDVTSIGKTCKDIFERTFFYCPYALHGSALI